MDPRDLIGRITDPDRRRSDFDPVQLLHAIRSEPVRASKLASEHPVSRQTLYRFLEPFVEIELIDQTEEGFQLTGAGEVFLQAFETGNQVIDMEVIWFMTASPNRPEILRQLSVEPGRKADIVAAEDSPSESTVGRILGESAAYGLIVRDDDGRYALTENGIDVLNEFDTLVLTAEQAIEKAPFLRRFGSLSTELPLAALTNSELVQASQDNAHAVLSKSVELADINGEGVDRLHSIVPIFSPVMYDAFDGLIDRNTRIRMILDLDTYRELRRPANLHYLVRAVIPPTMEIRVYPEPLTFGVATYDESAMIASYIKPHEHEAGLAGDDPSLVNWVDSTIQNYWEQSDPPSGRVVRDLQNYLD